MDNHFTVPDNYFEQLNRDIQTRIAEERLKALTDGKGFIVPDLYFEQLSNRIEAKLIPQEDKKVVKVVRLWNNDLLKYATAACFILITAFGLYLNNRPTETPVMPTEMASEQFLLDIDEQLILEDVGNQQLLQASTSASEKELETYILSNYSSNEIAANY
jgi:negative regulator of sigma E activity